MPKAKGSSVRTPYRPPEIEVHTVALPAFLASALINGDTSGFTRDEDDKLLAATERWLAQRRYRVVDVGESYFGRADFPWNFRGEIAEYTVYRHAR